MDSKPFRTKNLAALTRKGFKVSKGLPMKREGIVKVRPHAEIAARLMALQAVFLWTSFGEENLASKRLKAYVKRSSLEKWLTKDEKAILKTTRAKAQAAHGDSIGWRLENMWPLAWVLGMKKAPPCDGKMIDDKTIEAILFELLPGPEESVLDFVKQTKVRKLAEVAAMEDLFYCCHNAVRSAQLGGKTVPKGFDPIGNGGVIHERRHALTWVLSPGEAWDDTDLST
jgi:hypothetical protein